MAEISKKKYIKQIKLQGSKAYFPNKFYTPYQFMDKLNQAVQKRYDIRIIEVKYVISKSRDMKFIDQQFSTGNFEMETGCNNIYQIEDQFMKQILQDTKLLIPPKDFDYNKLQEENEAAKRREEDAKIRQIDQSLQLLANLSQFKGDKLNSELRSLDRFKMKLQPKLRQSQVEVYVKAVVNKVQEQKLQLQKSSKEPVVVSSTAKSEIRVYLHPVTKSQPQNIDFLVNLSPIDDWSLCSFFPQKANLSKSSQGITYWSWRQIQMKAQKSNSSIKIYSNISLHRNKKGLIDGIQIYSFLFNQIVIKAFISLAQIQKIDFIIGSKSPLEEQPDCTIYYLHLTYPPKYYISILKPDHGCEDGFIRSWERVQNFMFFRNQNISLDQFIRLFLFKNTVLQLKINRNKENRKKWEESQNLFIKILQQFKGTIDCNKLQKPWDLNKKVSSLNTIFKYKAFKSKLQTLFTGNHNPDKIWKLKYMIMVLIRYNFITPPQAEKLLNTIQQRLSDIDLYLYIIWQSVVLLGGVNQINIKESSYLEHLDKQYMRVIKMNISDITSKVTSNTESIVYVFKAFLTPSGYLYNAPTPQMKGRLLKEYSKFSQHFLRVSIADDNQGTLKNQKYITKGALKYHMQSISIIDRHFIPLGWSPSQLRSYSLWYIHEIKKGNQMLLREQVLSFLGNFDNISNAAKKAARIGQAFSASWTYICKENQIKQQVIPDEMSPKNYMYTDGIGKISRDLIEKIALKLSIRDLSILQIRYKGSKGLLVMDRRLGKNEIKLRKSMVKYECNHESAKKYLDILDWNKYKAGFLNRQTIILLKSLGIEDKVFLRRQQQHIQRISNLSFKDCSIFKHMNQDLNTDINNLEPANVTILQLLKAGFKLQEEPFFRGVLQTMKKNGYHQLKVKSNIMIQKSARIIGIIDQYNILKQGELYCTIFDNLDLKPRKEQVQGDVIITRNPCLHPGDIRKMTCLSQLEIGKRFQHRGQQNYFRDLVNCIIFPMKGDYPVTAQISGSDLDGDNFFICWDRQLVPQKADQFFLIDAPIEKKEVKKDEPAKSIEEQYKDMVHFFIEYLNYEKLGQIDNSHLVKADQSVNFAKDKECIELAKIHGKAVDFPKTGFCPQVDARLLVSSYPDFMQKEDQPQYMSKSILGFLYRDIQHKIENLLSQCEAKKSDKIDQEIIREITSQFTSTQTQKELKFDHDEVKEVLQILIDYETQLSGLIALVGVDTQFEIYSGNFTIAKQKVKVFGKNRLTATILNLRARYLDAFFSAAHLDDDRHNYQVAKDEDIQNPDFFSQLVRKRVILFYLASYIIRFNKDEFFLNDQCFGSIRKLVLDIYRTMSYKQEGKFCGFCWFVIPKLLINQKYRMRRILKKDAEYQMDIQEEQKKQVTHSDQDQEI